ncbi:MAG: Omp28-related outer membrane protein [Bacteroidia bacterium]|nr:Omp28-related outer membrane protein [Bacteroidia bacterium]MCZ2278440.1 Omp28-related outer membrane protein [Bacteroidia bacterium]
MKKTIANLFSLAVIGLAFASCQKESENIMVPNENGSNRTASAAVISPIGAPPTTFTQKVLIESFVSASAERTPMNDELYRNAKVRYPGRVFAANFHLNDRMTESATPDVYSMLNNGVIPGMPSAMQNRIAYNGVLLNSNLNWDVSLPLTLGATPEMGLAIQSRVTSGLLNVVVHSGFSNDLPGKFKLVAYLIEDNVTGNGNGYDQMNAGNNDPASSFYNKGNPIIGYQHNGVVRQLLTPAKGVSVPSSDLIQGGHFIHRISVDFLPGCNVDNCFILAFVFNEVTGQILNVQSAKLNRTQNWD